MEDNLNLRWKTVFCLWHFSSQILLCAKVYFFSGKFGSWWLTFERFPLEDVLWWALTTQLCCWSLASWRLFPSAELLECLSPLRSHFMDQSFGASAVIGLRASLSTPLDWKHEDRLNLSHGVWLEMNKMTTFEVPMQKVSQCVTTAVDIQTALKKLFFFHLMKENTKWCEIKQKKLK